MARAIFAGGCILLAGAALSAAEDGRHSSGGPTLQALDVFQLEYASDPRISPDGRHVVYERRSMDIRSDRSRSSLWVASSDGSRHRPLSSGDANHTSPRWSPDGTRLAYLSDENGGTQIYLRYMDSGQTARLTQLSRKPNSLTWSPDGRHLAFVMLVPERNRPLVDPIEPPEGASWAAPPVLIERMVYRADGRGYLEAGDQHVFVLPADGGTPRQLTTGPFHHEGPLAWTPDGRFLLVSANRKEDWEYDSLDTDIYELSLGDGTARVLTDRRGPDSDPTLSPDGRRIAYLGFDDRLQGYQVTGLYVMHRDGSDSRLVTETLDRDVERPAWSEDSAGLYFQYDDGGTTRLAHTDLDGKVENLASDVGGTSLGRPYSGGSFTAAGGRFAFTRGGPQRPADVAIGDGKEVRLLTSLNEDLLGHVRLGEVEEIRFDSSFDGRPIQGWIVKPPDFDPRRRYPLVLEIHGGPFANYGSRFSAEIQLYAAAGYVVLYTNPRGSTGYGAEFGNLIHHAYPGQDYDDLMSGVDAVIERGYVDADNLFVTGGSGGGVLSSWIVGKTDRFRAAVVAKPVINWTSFVLTADAYNRFYKYWFPGFPWDHPEHYHRRSPLSLVGNVTTPTMLLTGEVDYRTPISESEQYYQALKLRRVPAALVRIPEASHGIAERPSYLIAKVRHILAWFERFRAVEERS